MKMAQLVKMGVLKSKVSKVNRKMTLEQISLNFCFYIALNRISSNLSEWIIHEWIFGIAMLKPIFKAIPLYVRICFFLRSASPIIFFAIWIHWAKKKKIHSKFIQSGTYHWNQPKWFAVYCFAYSFCFDVELYYCLLYSRSVNNGGNSAWHE